MVAFNMRANHTISFLDEWYTQTMRYSTQDQMGFAYVLQKQGIIPYALPNNKVEGSSPHKHTAFYTKINHGW